MDSFPSPYSSSPSYSTIVMNLKKKIDSVRLYGIQIVLSFSDTFM